MIRKYHNHKLQTTHGTARKSHTTITRHQEAKLSKAIQLSLPHQDDCKARMDKSNVQQNIEQLQSPIMGVKINKSTTTEPPP